MTANASSAANAGLMLRQDLTDSSPCLYLDATRTGELSWQHRATTGGPTTATASKTPPAAPWLRLTRYGNVFTACTSTDGATWTRTGSPVTLALPPTIQAGMAMSSGADLALETARFTDVSLALPPAPAAPDGLTVSADGASILLSWDAVPEATSYAIRRATSPGGPFTTIASGVTAASYIDAPTADGATYHYIVTGSNSGGEGAAAAASPATLHSDYQQWKLASGLVLDTADSATSGGDATPVLLKFALGAAPGADVQAPSAPVTTPSRGISFTRLSPARATVVVQASSDLAGWSDIATLPYGSDTWTGIATVNEDTSTTPRTVTVLDNPAFDAEPRRFFRLRAERSAP